jgi:RepB plasmid partitioning protein/ParB-like nuclease domain
MTNQIQSNCGDILVGFEGDFIRLSLEFILPIRPFPATVRTSKKFKQIVASVREVGLVEPPVVARNPGQPGSFLLLDGHLRIEVLKDLGILEVDCLVSTDDEAFTYNKRISRLSAVQEHRMIVKAIERGVPEEKIAKALDIMPQSVRRKIKMLDGICEEVASILKDKQCPTGVFEILRKMKVLRQVEAAELLVNANNYSIAYASAILAGTPHAQLVDGSKPKLLKRMTPEAMARMEGELTRLQESFTSIKDSYGQDHLKLTVIKGYVAKLLGNARIVRYFMQNRPEFMAEFQAIAEMTSTHPP